MKQNGVNRLELPTENALHGFGGAMAIVLVFCLVGEIVPRSYATDQDEDVG